MFSRRSDQNAEKELREQYAYNLAQIAPQLPPLNVQTFLMLQEFMEPNDARLYSDCMKNIAKNLGIGFASGLFLSFGLTRANPLNFLTRPLYVRLPVRFMFIGTGLIFGGFLAKPQFDKMMPIEGKFNKRLAKFKATRDFNHMDPEGLLFQEFLRKSRGPQ